MSLLQPITILPIEIQNGWRAQVHPAQPTPHGVYRLVKIRTTKPKSFEEQRIIVAVIDENGFPLANVPVAFSYSTADQFTLTPDFLWQPPAPWRAFIVPTGMSGQIDQIQGSAVKPGEPGGITVYLLDPLHSSDAVSGLGMLGDHTGLHLTFQLQRTGVKPLDERISALEAWTATFDERLKTLEAK